MTKILLVEDDKSLREIYGVRLLAEGYDIVTAGDGEEALAMAIKERPQLIVSDVMMPKISGFDMLDILRSTSETKDIKVIMMTALSSEDQRARGEALGADRYLVKSQVGIEDVVRTVHEVLGDASVGGGSQPPQQPFSAQASGARPAPSVSPGQRPEMPAPPRAPQPATPVSPPPQPQPQQASAPQTQPQPSQTANGLPQPTAPFSTNRPANLGDRIIHPINQPESDQNIASRIQQELDDHRQPSTPPQPIQGIANQATPLPPESPQSEINQTSNLSSAPGQPSAQQPEPTQTATPQPSEDQSAQTSSQPEDPGIAYEETPRTSTPQPPVSSRPGSPQQ